MQFAFHRVISKGIADRYPNFRIAFLEAGCSWVPALVEWIEEYSGFPGLGQGVDNTRAFTGSKSSRVAISLQPNTLGHAAS